MAGGADPAFGLKISPSVVLRNLLQQYPSGGQFFLEALQNADDTGRAGKFCALLDLRRHKTQKLRQPVAARAQLQNEAILFYDDAGFKNRDWRSLQFMCDSEKRQSPHEAGVFGMGSRSFFHITDVLQVLSGPMLSLLDPDDILETGHFGEQTDFAKDDLLKKYPDEAAPFMGVFGCDMKTPFRGSIIRASLRTAEGAKKCTFMPQAFDLSRAKKIFREFEEVLRNGEVALFLTCVKSVELWQWEDGVKEPSLIARTKLGVSSGHKLPRPMSGPPDVKEFLMQFNSFAELEASLRKPDSKPPHICDIVDMETEVKSSGDVSTRRWLRFGFFSQDEKILHLVTKCACVPLTALALPLGESSSYDGCLFASLPLPLPTRLPVHVNSHFRLHDNRRAIWRMSLDLDGEHKLWAEWNEWILTVMVPDVYAQALELLSGVPDIVTDRGHSVWPKDSEILKEFTRVLDPLVVNLSKMSVLPTPGNKLVRPADALHFDTPTAALQACRQQLLQLCDKGGHTVVDPPEHIVELLHSRKALTKKPCTWVLWEVVLAAASSLPGKDLASLLLAYIEWAGSWREPEIRSLGEKMGGTEWMPTESGKHRTIKDAFHPVESPEVFTVVKENRAKLDSFIADMSLKGETVWRVLDLCGLKKELTWEDAVAEAEAVVRDNDVARAELLLAHLNKKSATLKGSRADALKKLQELAWLPAMDPNKEAQPTKASKLLALKDIFPPSATKIVWAVAPSLSLEATIKELKAGKSVETEPQVLVEQVRALAESAAKAKGKPPYASAAALGHLTAAFSALLPLLAKLPNLKEHPRLADVAFVPCMPSDGKTEGAELFCPRSCTFKATHGHEALSPVIGIVKPGDSTIRVIAEAASVTKEPRADVLAEALCKSGADKPKPELAVTLAIELAARLRAKEERPEKVMVPTSSNTIEGVDTVFINDAPWQKQHGKVTLHGKITPEDGHLLGCTSLREQMARQCEDQAKEKEEEADVVSRVRKLLGSSAELITEVVLNSDEVAATSLAFYLREDAFGKERVVDLRTADLQGPALYVCCDKKLSAEDILRMQSAAGPMNGEKKPGSSASLGKGFTAMFRHSDCPQLLANGQLHFFDLTKSFVSRDAMPRGRCFATKRLQEHFPDSISPFEVKQFAGKYPTVFRLPLRVKRSDLGLQVETSALRTELQDAAALADKALIFARHLRKVEFYDGDKLVASHESKVKDAKAYEKFFAALPASPVELKAGGDAKTCLASMTITTKGTEEASCEWAIAHHVVVKNEEMAKAVKTRHEQSDGASAMPHGATAVKLKAAAEEEPRGGKVCCGWPTTFRSNSCTWTHGNFALTSSRKALPLPEEKDKSPTGEKQWNKLILEGPVAESMRDLVMHCTTLVLKHELQRHRYFTLFPLHGDRLQNLLAAATFTLEWVLVDVMLPKAKSVPNADLPSLLLAFLEWIGAWKEAEIRSLGKKLAEVEWIPTEGGKALGVADVFDPKNSPEAFRVVKEKRANIDSLLVAMDLNVDTVWRVLHLCGLKKEITWEDAVEEAKTIVDDGDVERATLLFEHLNKKQSSLAGARAAAIETLQGLAWVPAKEADKTAKPEKSTKLRELKDLFPPAATKLIWAVAPSASVESSIKELKPGRSIEAEPEILIEQVKALAETAATDESGVPHISSVNLEHLVRTFGALLQHLSKLPALAEHEALVDVAFVPCLSSSETSEGADLFKPRCAAFKAQHDSSALRPILGIVKPGDQTIRTIAEAANVGKEPRADVLAEALVKLADADADDADLAVTLANELAARLRAKEERPVRIMVPTENGKVKTFERVYIDDAPWRHSTEIMTLHPRVSAENGRLLGCTSLRDEMARLCEDDGTAKEGEEEAFGQEADLVSQVRQLLQEYGDGADLVTEFVQNNDDAGAGCVAFYLVDEKFGTERVVDPRTTALQGPALYVCSDKPLTADDITRMQRVGRSEKRLDFKSSGRFGVGLNVMYRYCDCPQLLANGRLHYFDLTQKFVAKPGMRRGRQFTIEKLHEAFPDSHAPFENTPFADRFPTIFRLALRSKRSDLGVQMDMPTVRSELSKASEIADKMLLFTRNLKRLEFHDGKKLINSHEASVKDLDAYMAFFRELPASMPELKAGKYNQIITQKNIVTESPKGKTDAEWAIAHRVGGDQAMLDVMKAQFDQPHGVALLPHGAAAARVKPAEDELRGGRICVGLPTPFRSNSCAWINGSFALLSSRKTLPLPDDKETKPTLDKQWNKMLLEGPVAQSMRSLILHCTAMVLFSGMDLERYFGLIPIRGDRLQTILAQATMKNCLKDAVFPVAKGAKKMTWVQGPTPPFFCKELSDEVQECLVQDGLRLVALPPELIIEYEEALGKPKEAIQVQDLCKFLRETYEKLHPEVKNAEPEPESKADGMDAEVGKGFELDPEETGMECLSKKAYIMELLKFTVKGIWATFAKAKAGKFTKFVPEDLAGVPLCMTHAQEVTTFKNGTKFSTWRDILPEKKSLFLDRETYVTVMDSVDTTIVGVSREVETEIPGVRPFTLRDLLPYRAEVERSVDEAASWNAGGNEALRVFWSLVAETFAEDLQAVNYSEMYKSANRAFHDAKDGKTPDKPNKPNGEKGDDKQTSMLKPDTNWSKVLWDWKVLPICSKDGVGENGETIMPLEHALKCVAVTLVTSEEDVVRSLSELLTDCGIDIIQHDVLSDNRISRLLRTLVAGTNEEMLKILFERGNFDSLTGVQRHDLLAYFSVLSVKGGVDLHGVTRLPLFKTASMDSSFIALEGDTQYCCVDPTDPHSKALSKLMPPGMVMLAWPTQQVKPIYEHCSIQLCSGEEFMVTQIIPRLPEIVDSGPNGKIAEPFFAELHAFVVTDDSDKVKRAAMDSEFVTSEDFSRKGTPSMFTSPNGGAASAFKEVLSAHLPAKWMQKSDKHMELLHALGMEKNLTPAMILMCAKDLDSGVGEKAENIDDNALALIEDEDEKEEKEEKADGKEGEKDEKGEKAKGKGKGKGKRQKQEFARELRTKSFELVEEWARAADEVWPKRSLGTSAQTAPEYKHGEKVAMPPTRDPVKVEDMACLIEAASLRILMARRHKTQKSRKEDALDRNSVKKLKTKPMDKGQGPSSADLELVSFFGTAFSKSRQVLWTICPLSAHGSSNKNKEGDTKYLKKLLEDHKKGMFDVFGAYVMPGQAPLELVMRHMACLCTIMQTDPGSATVNTDSFLHEDFRACWQYLSEHLTVPLPEELNTPMCQQVLAQLKDLPCVAVSSEDAANVSVDVTTLTRPRFAFFQLPLLKGKQANLRLYLRQVLASTASEASIFRMLGATDTPRASHFAGASERVAAKAQELGRANWEWVVSVLEACMKGVYEDLIDKAANALEGVKKDIKNLHMFTTEGTIMPAAKLVWADEPRWLKRCERTKVLHFCALNGPEQRDIANAFVEHLGMRQLTKLVEERRMADSANPNEEEAENPRAFKERLERLVRAPEFTCGLHAVMEHQAEQSKKPVGITVTGVGQELRTIRFRAARTKLRSALFWKERELKKKWKTGRKRKAGEEDGEKKDGEEEKEGDAKNGEKKDEKKEDAEMKDGEKKADDKDEKKEGEEDEEKEEEEEEDVNADLPQGSAFSVIEGSEQDQQVYFDEFERTVYIGDADSGDDSFTAECVFALRRALPLLWNVDNFLLEAMLRCAITEGPMSIAGFLEKRDIKVNSNMPRQLGPGDQLPEDLQDSLVWSMDSTYAEGECCAVLINEVFTIAEVCKFPTDQKQGEGLTRSYFLKLTSDKFEAKKHFEVYKIRTNRMTPEGMPAETETTELALYSEKAATESSEKKAAEPEKAGEGEKAKEMTEEDEETTIKDLKRYLHEMGQMEPDDYKAVMRRLFKTWHPDKAGDTPLSKRIFHMLRAHEQWYKKRQSGEEAGDDSWLDKEDGQKPTGPKPSGGEDDGKLLALEGPEGGGEDAGAGQSSWFEEFEKEMKKARDAKEAGEDAKPYNRMPGAGEAAPENKRDKIDWEREQQEREEKAAQVRIVDKVLASRYLQEAKLELVAVRRLMQEVDGVRSMPSRAVWHCQQAVEMALKAAMLRTCGVAEDEVVGGAAHDLIDFVQRLKTAEVNTEEQRRAQKVPLEADDVEWLKRAYLAARYPKPGRYGVPTLLYSDSDAARALKLAEGFLQWAEHVEDLPDPNKFRRRWSSTSVASTIKDNTPKDAKEADMPTASAPPAPSGPRGALGQRGKAAPSKPPAGVATPKEGGLGLKRVNSTDSTASGPSSKAAKSADTGIAAPTAKAPPPSGLKRPSGDGVVVDGENEPPRRWAKRNTSQ